MEDFYIGGASVKLFLPIFKMNFPEIVDIALPAEGVFHNLLFVSIRKTYPMQAYKIMHGLWGMGQMMFTKYLVVVDDDVDVHNTSDVLFRLCANTDAIARAPKVLLTATPLQNSLLELFGLVSIIDEYAFGDLKSFKAQFSRLTSDDQFADLKERLRPVCQRTLRRQVLEYVKYTNRIPITQEFFPSDEEQRLYDLVSDFGRSPL